MKSRNLQEESNERGDMKQSMTLSICCAVVVMVILGCQTPCTSGAEIDVREGAPACLRWDDSMSSPRLELAEAPVIMKTEFGFLRGNVRVRSCMTHDFAFQYKFCWFDGNGLEVMPGKGIWEQKTIHGNEALTLSGVAPDPSAVRFTMRLRFVR